VGLAATIGREFSTDVLAAAATADGDQLVHGLDELWRRGIIREQGGDSYDFSHDRIREVAYQSLGPALRRHCHLSVATALEQLFAGEPGMVSGLLAAHYERAGRVAQAVDWYRRAAEAAQRLHADVEAIRLIDRALDLLRALPESRAREQRELELLVALPASFAPVEGYASERLFDVQRRALVLERSLGVESAAPLLSALAMAALAHDEFERAREIGEQLAERARRDNNDILAVHAAYIRGISAFWSGELLAAREHFEHAVERYHPAQHEAHVLAYGHDPGVICQGRLGNTLWLLGYPRSAVAAADAACALGDQSGHPLSRVTAMLFAALLAIDMRDDARIRRWASSLRHAGSEYHHWAAQLNADALGGYVDVLDGHPEAGVARIRGVLDRLGGARPAPAFRTIVSHILVAACVARGDTHGALKATKSALRLGGMRVWEADLRRLHADLSSTLGAACSEVDDELDLALRVARAQSARSLELRVLMSQLRQHLRHGDEASVGAARAELATSLASFPEPGEYPDLRDAHALLDESWNA
jgi:tetratricopeptide (TPR) repeat protein